ncbi:MAG: hypothetical protein WCP70_06215, partial [Methanothrix sp.]
QRLLKTIPGSLQHRYPCGAAGSSARWPLDCGCLARLPALARAYSPWSGPCGVAALLSGRAGGRSGLIPGGAGPE